MKIPPLNEKLAKTGTNVRRSPFHADYTQQLTKRMAFLNKALSLYQKHSRKLFTKAERRLAVPLTLAARQALQRQILQKQQDATRSARFKRQQRIRLDREFARVLPNFRIWRKLTKEYQRHFLKITRLGFARNAQIALLGDLDIDLVDPQEFQAPFPLYDTQPAGASPLLEDRSIVVPENGHMQNRFEFNHDGDSGFLVDAWFQIERAFVTNQSVGCGINYTVPQTGRLQVHAALQNYVSRVFWSMTDLFGLSFGTLHVEQRLVIRIARRDRSVISLATTLTFSGVTDSPGIDASGLLSPLDNSLPYDLEGTTSETFSAGENVQIFVNSEIHIASDMNDMASHVNALVWWQLQQISVSVV